ncbi:hypothetical protein P3X46_021041 [Hevea brasiliensis]|uniref:RRM domain-containing protein n=1 Tax=Hevea brasiliensis TaxID=3981 RepID=A0ABQ9LE79_HEVBR|nr:hypothetical protein P3X46_021041 [Hevea brasiliensis]
MAQIQVQHQPGPNGVAETSGGIPFMPTWLCVGDLDLNVTDSQLFDLFSQVGPIVSVRVCTDLTTLRSLGYGYVNYNNPQDAARALDVLNFTPLNNKPIRIMCSHRDPSVRKSGTGNIFIKSRGYGFVQFDNEECAQNAIDKLIGMLIMIKKFIRNSIMSLKNLSESTEDEDLMNIFGEYGVITSFVVMRDADGKSNGFVFVNLENADDAAKTVESLNGKKFDDKEWYLELKIQFEQRMKEAVDKFQGVNLYIVNLDDSINDEKLKELFADFGTITSCKVMCDPSEISRGSGFVAFSTLEEASCAAQFSQMRPVTMASSVAPRMPIHSPGTGLGQQFLYSQAPSAIIPPRLVGYQQQLVPGMRPGCQISLSHYFSSASALEGVMEQSRSYSTDQAASPSDAPAGC